MVGPFDHDHEGAVGASPAEVRQYIAAQEPCRLSLAGHPVLLEWQARRLERARRAEQLIAALLQAAREARNHQTN